MFDDLQATIRTEVVNTIYHLQVTQQAPPAPPTRARSRAAPTRATTRGRAATALRGVRRPPARASPCSVGTKVGRNDPCPCGSGKKFKRCHGA